jgi:hypothetical protein
MNPLNDQLSLAPLGAGDLIDRAVRMYRQHFFTLIRIAAPPVLLSALGSTIMTIAVREISATGSDVRLALYVFMGIGGFAITICGSLFSVIVIGGATRNLVAHLLSSERVSARATYRAVKERFWSLLGGSVLVAFWLALAAGVASMGGAMVFWFVAIASFVLSSISPWLTGITVAIGIIAATILGLCLFFLLAGRAAYVPQAIMVEGRTVFEAIGRSFGLASGNVRRLMAMTLFTVFATYSALMLLIIPLGWYGYLNGVDISPFSRFEQPAWYAIGYEVIWQCSHILLAPIWMLGLSLLYVDERVRHEGYDIELMAARQLPEMPNLPGVVSPFAPALVTGRAPKFVPPPPGQMNTGSVLGLS